MYQLYIIFLWWKFDRLTKFQCFTFPPTRHHVSSKTKPFLRLFKVSRLSGVRLRSTFVNMYALLVNMYDHLKKIEMSIRGKTVGLPRNRPIRKPVQPERDAIWQPIKRLRWKGAPKVIYHP